MTDKTPSDDEPVVTPATVTSYTRDYLDRALINANPGVSNATDYAGRAIATFEKDYMGRPLKA